jgi:hypothetical protein
MPIKLKPSQKIRSKATGKFTIKHFYLKTMRLKELEDVIKASNTKPKVREKCKREIVRRYKN